MKCHVCGVANADVRHYGSRRQALCSMHACAIPTKVPLAEFVRRRWGAVAPRIAPAVRLGAYLAYLRSDLPLATYLAETVAPTGDMPCAPSAPAATISSTMPTRAT